MEVEEENQTLASITYQNYFRLYKKLSGMTGTAMTESEEFYDIYKLNVVSIPTNKKMLRKDFNDQIFRTEIEKYNAITNKIIECNKRGQPVLVGTTSIEKSEKISNFLKSKDIKHQVLNAKQHDKEASLSCCFALRTWCLISLLFKKLEIFSDFSILVVPTKTG